MNLIKINFFAAGVSPKRKKKDIGTHNDMQNTTILSKANTRKTVLNL
jgi:hypothetical protein